MIRLISMFKRKPGTTHEQFLTHWFERHAPLIANSSAANYVLRYEQHPASWPSGSGPEPEWDGVTIQEFESVQSFYAHMTESDFAAMQADIELFLDVDNIAWVLVDEARVVIGEAGVITAGRGLPTTAEAGPDDLPS